MKERRCRHFNSSGVVHLAVFRNNLLDSREDDLTQLLLVRLCETTLFLEELRRTVVVVHPYERPPDLNVPKIVLAERFAPFASFIQLEIALKRMKHGAERNRKESLDNGFAIVSRQFVGGSKSQIERFVSRGAGSIFLELHEQ